MDAAVAAIVGAAVGAVASIVGQVLAGRHQQQLERTESGAGATRRARQGRARSGGRGFGGFILSLLHSADWLTWHARYDPAAVTKELLGQYQKEAHESMPRLMAAITILGSLDPDLQDRLLPQASRVSVLDGRIGGAAAGFDSDPDAVRAALSALIPDVEALRRSCRLLWAPPCQVRPTGVPSNGKGFATRTKITLPRSIGNHNLSSHEEKPVGW